VSLMSPKERLARVLGKKSVDRPPVICTGGMMNAAIVEIMQDTGQTLPEAHFDDICMAALAGEVQQATGFENLGIPFCMTVEAEVLGSDIDFGTLACEPKIAREVFPSVSAVSYKDIKEMIRSGRIDPIVQAAHRLAKVYPDIPVIGNLTGPVSTAASIVDPIPFLKELRKSKDDAHRVLDYVTDLLIEFAYVMIDNGVAVISIGDPTATGEILGPKMFAEYPLHYINKIIDAVHQRNVPVIVHICGNMNVVKHLLPEMKADAISTDAMVNLRLLKEEFPQLTTMGNLSTYLLEFGSPEKVAAQARSLVRDGIDIISPACGLSTSTILKNIQAMTGEVKEG
jgi:MtaA/CmuA family methyltransferase